MPAPPKPLTHPTIGGCLTPWLCPPCAGSGRHRRGQRILRTCRASTPSKCSGGCWCSARRCRCTRLGFAVLLLRNCPALPCLRTPSAAAAGFLQLRILTAGCRAAHQAVTDPPAAFAPYCPAHRCSWAPLLRPLLPAQPSRANLYVRPSTAPAYRQDRLLGCTRAC